MTLTVVDHAGPRVVVPGPAGRVVVGARPSRVTVATRGLQGPPGPAGAGGAAEVVTVAVGALSALVVVRLGPGGVVPFSPDAGEPGRVLGVTLTAAGAGGAITVVTGGPLSSPGAGLTPGAVYWAGAGGALVSAQPTAGLLVAIGYAADPDTLVVQVGDPIELT